MYERMNIEEDGKINNLEKELEPKSAKDFIVLFGDEALEELVVDIFASWRKISEINEIALDDSGSIYALKLRIMTQASKGVMKTFLHHFLH